METSKKWFWILFDILVAAVVIVVLFGLLPYLGSLSSSYVPARVVNVSAQGKTTATPDLAELTFSVVTQGKSPSDLSDKNNTSMNAVIQFVSSQGVASSDIQTTSYDLQPNYGSSGSTQCVVPSVPTVMSGGTASGVALSPQTIICPPTRPQVIVSYTLTQTVQVKIRDLTKVANIMGGLAPLGVNQIGGVNFTFSDPDAVVALARADAISKAKSEAQAMANDAGASLGRITNINESQYFPMAYKTSYGMGGAGVNSLAAVPPTISPGTQDITDTVNVTYELK